MGGKRSPLDVHKPRRLELIVAERDLTLREIRGGDDAGKVDIGLHVYIDASAGEKIADLCFEVALPRESR
jgi:hypothetical protein